MFLRVIWEPFEDQFLSIETSIIDCANLIFRLANVQHQILSIEESQENKRESHIHVILSSTHSVCRSKAQGDIEMVVKR